MKQTAGKRFPHTMFPLILVLMGSGVLAQGLSLELTEQGAGKATFAVRYEAGASAVSALQFDLALDSAVLDGTAMRAVRGKDVSQDFQLEARQIQPGTVRVLLIPPIRVDLPNVANGEIAVFVFAVKGGATVTAQSIDFVRRAVVLSDRSGRAVQVRALQNHVGRQPRVVK